MREDHGLEELPPRWLPGGEIAAGGRARRPEPVTAGALRRKQCAAVWWRSLIASSPSPATAGNEQHPLESFLPRHARTPATRPGDATTSWLGACPERSRGDVFNGRQIRHSCVCGLSFLRRE